MFKNKNKIAHILKQSQLCCFFVCHPCKVSQLARFLSSSWCHLMHSLSCHIETLLPTCKQWTRGCGRREAVTNTDLEQLMDHCGP